MTPPPVDPADLDPRGLLVEGLSCLEAADQLHSVWLNPPPTGHVEVAGQPIGGERLAAHVAHLRWMGVGHLLAALVAGQQELDEVQPRHLRAVEDEECERPATVSPIRPEDRP